MAIYGYWIVCVTEACDKVLLNGHGHLMINDGNYHGNYCYKNSLTSDKLQGNMHHVDSAMVR